jgi:hypothetical protein
MPHRSNRLAPRRGLLSVAALAGTACLALAGSAFAAGAAQAAPLPTFSVTVNASSITVGTAPKSGAVNVLTSVSGLKEAGAILFLLKPGVTYAEVESFLAEKKKGQGDPNKASKFGSLVFDAEAEPGHASEAQTYLQPGQYLALAISGEGGPKFHTQFTVAAAASPIALPAPQATIRSIEFGFTGPTTLHDGELVRFENEGFLVHMDAAFQVKSMKTAKKLVKALLAGNEKAANKLAIGGAIFAGPLSSGAYQQETITAKPGIYVQACFMDTQDHRSHTTLGMERIIKITK